MPLGCKISGVADTLPLRSTPWFHPEAVVFLSSLLKSDWTIFETGSGGSTIWFSSRVKKVISVEHSKRWYDKVKKVIRNKRIKNIDLQLNPDYPKTGIQDFKEDEFDFVSIDGIRRSRVKCIKTAIPFLKSGGYLLLDDSEVIFYEEAVVLLHSWESKIFGNNHLHATTIWRKP